MVAIAEKAKLGAGTIKALIVAIGEDNARVVDLLDDDGQGVMIRDRTGRYGVISSIEGWDGSPGWGMSFAEDLDAVGLVQAETKGRVEVVVRIEDGRHYVLCCDRVRVMRADRESRKIEVLEDHPFD
jgi:hypothetical protein